jgi:hypothetical protein
MCQSDPQCEWLTFNRETNFCKLLKNCQTLNEEACPNCLTSQQDCIQDDPICFVVGVCLGNTVDSKFSTSPQDCLGLCYSNRFCQWFTFDTFTTECLLMDSCLTLDESCEDCISGERRCIEVTSTTTEIASTTTDVTSQQDSVRDDPICFIVGECLGNTVDIHFSSSAEDCLASCNSTKLCQWFTFYSITTECLLLLDCSTLDESSVEYISGERRCIDSRSSTTEIASTTTEITSQQDSIRDEPICFIVGDCLGLVVDVNYSPSAEDCLERCNSTDLCQWFTFDSQFPVCTLFQNSVLIDPSCETCVSGERRCIDSRSSTTEITSTTTAYSSSTFSTQKPKGSYVF